MANTWVGAWLAISSSMAASALSCGRFIAAMRGFHPDAEAPASRSAALKSSVSKTTLLPRRTRASATARAPGGPSVSPIMAARMQKPVTMMMRSPCISSRAAGRSRPPSAWAASPLPPGSLRENASIRLTASCKEVALTIFLFLHCGLLRRVAGGPLACLTGPAGVQKKEGGVYAPQRCVAVHFGADGDRVRRERCRSLALSANFCVARNVLKLAPCITFRIFRKAWRNRQELGIARLLRYSSKCFSWQRFGG